MPLPTILSRSVRIVCVAALFACIASPVFATPVAAPEIDPGSAGTAITMLLGSLALLERRRS